MDTLQVLSLLFTDNKSEVTECWANVISDGFLSFMVHDPSVCVPLLSALQGYELSKRHKESIII